mmetsp:Transcript_126859/g.232759  ORF Transcript_126859/g.232759 Transcript_126859/m.232759 type:complete len:251 (-) Transcript_126859:171-923(-)
MPTSTGKGILFCFSSACKECAKARTIRQVVPKDSPCAEIIKVSCPFTLPTINAILLARNHFSIFLSSAELAATLVSSSFCTILLVSTSANALIDCSASSSRIRLSSSCSMVSFIFFSASSITCSSILAHSRDVVSKSCFKCSINSFAVSVSCSLIQSFLNKINVLPPSGKACQPLGTEMCLASCKQNKSTSRLHTAQSSTFCTPRMQSSFVMLTELRNASQFNPALFSAEPSIICLTVRNRKRSQTATAM